MRNIRPKLDLIWTSRVKALRVIFFEMLFGEYISILHRFIYINKHLFNFNKLFKMCIMFQCHFKILPFNPVCIDSHGRSGGLGVIGRDGGLMFQTSINLIRK
jgi:hypothetical protein